jgi:Fur family ferric uptake transcriptional regulator
MSDPPAVPSVVDLQAMLRTAGLRSTSARISVLQRLIAARRPVSHAELAELLVPEGYDRATVYRNLMDLTEANLASRTELGDHVWRFEYRTPGAGDHASEHAHFLCTDCGAVACLPGVKLDLTPAMMGEKPGISSVSSVLLKGKCEQCVAPLK